MIDQELAGKYRIEKKIGQGGFGSVYRGFDINLKRPVAIKILTNIGGGGAFKARFQRESESLAKLNHPNIVTLFDTGEYEDRPYQVMEFVDGINLQDLISKTTLAHAELCSLCLQVCDAMVLAHGQGIIHRDLTLNNIMVEIDEKGKKRAKILDFGLAKLMRSDAQTTGMALMGTPSFMSPEQVKGQSVDFRTDIFSFGVGLFRILNGCLPFEAEHPTAVMYLIVNETNLNFAEGIPESLEEIVRSCLEKDPRNRPRDFGQLAKKFAAIQVTFDVTAAERTGITPLTQSLAARSSKRNPYLNRVMIKNPADFFGREKEIRKIYSRLDAPHPQSISIVGDRRIGKSSLLNFIYHRGNRRENMQNHENSLFVYLDFQSDVDFTVTKFIDFLFTVFSYETKLGKELAAGEKSLDKLKEAVKTIHDSGNRIIVLMDEFESITRNPNFDEGFFSFLRALANSYRVAYITSSCDELQLMCHNKDISDSPFFNIFSNLPLRPFLHKEALDLISVPSRTEGIPLEPYGEKIIDLAGYFPFYLQIACSCVFENLLDKPGEDPDWSRIFANFSDEAFPHFEFTWKRMEYPEQENLIRIATEEKINKKYQFVNDNLLRRGYLIQKNSKIDIFSQAFKYYILRQQQESHRNQSIFSRLFGKKRKTPEA